MNRESVQRLLSLGEGQNLEFKAGIDPKSIGREICAFLNSGGGYLILGVAEDGEITGIPPGQNRSSLEQNIASGLAPSALVSFEEHILEGKPVWVIEIPAGQDIPYGYQDEIFIRVGGQTQRADVVIIRDMILRRQVAPERWERRFSDADLDRDLDREEVRAATRLDSAKQRAGADLSGAVSAIEVLERLGLVKYGRLTNGGDVLFSAHPAVRHPQTRLRAACYASDKSDDSYRDFKSFEGPLVQVLEQAYAFIQRNTPSRSDFHAQHLAREEQSLYPPEAIREGLVNAFAHRDYADFRGGIAVHIYPNRLEIWNAGGLPDGITPETLAQGHLSVLRNPDIAHVLYLRGLMEKLGRGGVLIRKACEARGLPPPVWKADAQSVTLTFPTTEVATGVATGVDMEVATEVQTVLKALTGDMSRSELQEKLGFKNAEHFRKHYLAPALEGGYVAMTLPDKPNSRLQRYRITQAGRQAREREGNKA